MERVNWKVEGMTCANCVLTINKYLERKGLQNVKLNLAGGDLSFDINGQAGREEIEKGIRALGYTVVVDPQGRPLEKKKTLNPYLRYLAICAPFTILLMLHMLDPWLHLHWLMNPWVQLALCLPVYLTGMRYFGRSAVKSIRNGMPNMNVLIALGATAAFIYSLAGTVMHLGKGYMFYETTAVIICFVFLGYYIEDISVHATQKALQDLARTQRVMAHMIAFDDKYQENIFPVESTSLRTGDLVLINSGEQVPSDCKILWGEGSADESILTGESLPVHKQAKDLLLGGSLLVSGSVKAQVTAPTSDSVIAGIIRLMQQAQGEKPPVQQLADRISAVFVPVVLGLAALSFLLNYFFLHEFTPSIMRSIAVLVIACPCAMGLATPAAVAVGLGRAARNGILFRHAKSLEKFREIRQVVFDKTGTLTTGSFVIGDWFVQPGSGAGGETLTPEEFKRIAYSIEKYSSHPIARAISREWKTKDEIKWKKVEEVKGLGVKAITAEGKEYWAGSYKTLDTDRKEDIHNVYISRDNQLLGWINVKDEIRPEAAEVISYLRARNIRTILLSGDHDDHCRQVAAQLGIPEVISGQHPDEKLQQVEILNARATTAMVGDGINDAPALAKASIGISMSDASHLAIQTADVVLTNKGIRNLPLAIEMGIQTYRTIRQNLFWAFFYNVIAIPIAAFGFLTPGLAALAMGFSDLVLVGNSVRLHVKKLR